MPKGKHRAIKSMSNKKRKKALNRINIKPSLKKPKEEGRRLMIMPTDILLVYFATLPLHYKIGEADEDLTTLGEELLNFANTLQSSPGGEKQRKFIIATVWIAAHVMKVQELLTHPLLIWLNTELPKQAEEIHSEHFKNTVLSDWSLYMQYMKYFLVPAGVKDVDSTFESVQKRREMI